MTQPNPNAPDAGMVFDAAPVSQPVTVPSSSPAPVTANQNANTGADDGMVFDSAPAPQTPGVPAAQPQPATMPAMYATEGSLPGAPLAAKLKLWAQNLQSDLKFGTDITGVGSLLKKMGAHGLYYGEPQSVGDFMGSLPLGLLRATQGGAEAGLPGERWQATKDVVGGALDASQMPSMFVSPGAGEAAGAVGDLALTQAGRAAEGAKSFVSIKALQPKLQGVIRSVLADVAQEHSVPVSDTTSLRDLAQGISDGVRAKAHAVYQTLDNALGGTRFQVFDEQLSNINRAIRDSLGIDPEKDAALAKRLEQVTTAKNAAMDEIKAKGLDPDGLIDQADALHKRAMALQDVSKAVRASTDAHPSQVVDGATTAIPSNVKTAPFFKRIQALDTPNPKFPGAPSRLEQALGSQRSAELLHAVDSAHLAAQKIAARNAWIRRGATALGLAGLGREAFNGVHDLLSSAQ